MTGKKRLEELKHFNIIVIGSQKDQPCSCIYTKSKINNVWVNNFKDVDDLYKKYSNLRQVTTTHLCHDFRQSIVVDCDLPFNIDNTNKTILKRCEQYNLPYPNYVERHRDSNHYQIGWYLKEGINIVDDINHMKFLKVLRTMGKIFDGDMNYNGFYCKNPYNIKNEPFWFNDKPVDDETFFTLVLGLSKQFNIEVVNKTTSNKRRNNHYEHEFKDDTSSRNIYGMKYSTRKLWDYMREHNSEPSTFEMFLQWFKEGEYESLNINGKSDIEEEKSIISSAKGAYQWSIKHFHYNKQNKYTDESREYSLINRRTNRAIKYFKIAMMLKKHMSKRSIAKALKVSMSNIMELSKQDEQEMINTLINFINQTRGITVSKVMDLVKASIEVLSLYGIEVVEEDIVNTSNYVSEEVAIEAVFNLFVNYVATNKQYNKCYLKKYVPKVYDLKVA